MRLTPSLRSTTSTEKNLLLILLAHSSTMLGISSLEVAANALPLITE